MRDSEEDVAVICGRESGSDEGGDVDLEGGFDASEEAEGRRAERNETMKVIRDAKQLLERWDREDGA